MAADDETCERFDSVTGEFIGPEKKEHVADYATKLAMLRLLSVHPISGWAISLGIALVWCANTKSGECFPGRAKLRQDLGGSVSHDTLRLGAKALEKTGLVKLEFAATATGGLRCRYVWDWPSAQRLAADNQGPPQKYALPVKTRTPRKSKGIPQNYADHPEDSGGRSPQNFGQGPLKSEGLSLKEIPEKDPGNQSRVADDGDASAMTSAAFFRSVDFNESDLKAALNEALQDQVPGELGLLHEIREATGLSRDRLLAWRTSRRKCTPFKADQFASIASRPAVANALAAIVAEREARDAGLLSDPHCKNVHPQSGEL